MSAQYGGRVSAVIDCKLKEGNMNKYQFSSSFTPFSSTLTANGPLKRKRSSFFFSTRKSLTDLYLGSLGNSELIPSFYDVNLKFNSIINPKNRIFVSFYKGNDIIKSTGDFFNTWGNNTGTVRWNYNSGKKIFLNTTLIFSDYKKPIEYYIRCLKWLSNLN